MNVDSNYVETCHAQGVFPLLYYPHNYHFLSATATLEGNSRLALEAAYKVAEMMDEQLMREPGWETREKLKRQDNYLTVHGNGVMWSWFLHGFCRLCDPSGVGNQSSDFLKKDM